MEDFPRYSIVLRVYKISGVSIVCLWLESILSNYFSLFFDTSYFYQNFDLFRTEIKVGGVIIHIWPEIQRRIKLAYLNECRL